MAELNADKTIDSVLEFTDVDGANATWHLRIFPRTGKKVVILTDVDAGGAIGTERVATKILQSYGLDPDTTIWIKHTPPNISSNQETYALIQFNWDGKLLSQRGSLPFEIAEVEALVGQKLPPSQAIQPAKKKPTSHKKTTQPPKPMKIPQHR